MELIVEILKLSQIQFERETTGKRVKVATLYVDMPPRMVAIVMEFSKKSELSVAVDFRVFAG